MGQGDGSLLQTGVWPLDTAHMLNVFSWSKSNENSSTSFISVPPQYKSRENIYPKARDTPQAVPWRSNLSTEIATGKSELVN